MNHLTENYSGPITRFTPLNKIFQINANVCIDELKDQSEANDLHDSLWGYSRVIRPSPLKKIQIERALKMIETASRELPREMDQFGNDIERTFVCDEMEFQEMCAKLGCKSMIDDTDIERGIHGFGSNIFVHYCEGDVVIYRGRDSISAYHNLLHNYGVVDRT